MKSQGLMLGYYKTTHAPAFTPTAGCTRRQGPNTHEMPKATSSITGRVKDLFKTSKGKYVAGADRGPPRHAPGGRGLRVVTGANLSQPVGC